MPRPRSGKQKKVLKPRLHIFCEGAKTEPNYLNGYIELCFPGTKLTVVEKTDKTTPVQLVDEAIAAKSRRDGLDTDKFWVVYDRESVNKYPPALHDQARDKARSNGIKVALSNVCFEVWILLHFQGTVAIYDCYDDLLHQSRLKEYIPSYDKGVKWEFSKDEVAVARKNAARLNKQTIAGADRSWSKEHQWNPYTDVYKLLDAMDKHQKEYG